MATIDYTVTATSISLQLKSLESTDKGKIVDWYIALDKSNYPDDSDPATYNTTAQDIMNPWATDSTPVLVRGLNFSFNIKVLCVVKTAGGEPVTKLRVGATHSHVSLWDWEISNGSATAEQTLQAKNAVYYKTAPENFNYKVWNDLVDKVLDILWEIGALWQIRYAGSANTKMSPSDKVLTAVRFNSLIYNIEFHCGGININIPSVSQGDKVYGRYLLRIAECINDWIDLISIS